MTRAAAADSIVVVSATDRPPDGWDALTVEPVGGHVLQGVAWAAHRRARGWQPRFVRFSDDRAALLLLRRQRPLPGFLASAPRGPVACGDAPAVVAQRALALADWLRSQGGTILAVDPELDADPAYDAALRAGGFLPTEEIQPSRHRLVLDLSASAAEADREAAVLAGVAKTTRQRIRSAQKSGTTVEEDAEGRHLEQLERLMDATARRRHFVFGAEQGFAEWWSRVLSAGHARFFVARNGDRLLGALFAYLQGGHLATAFSADRAKLRREYPGTMHLLRWEAIQAAMAAGMSSIDLGGVDVAGQRSRPGPDDSTWGMYEHKSSFGARWVESAAAHETLLRPWLYRTSLALRRARGVARRLRG
ncbi:MAG: lipid II:glycine glycyltransferase FemX [Candidatus Limnocylindrales bacterium]